MFGERSIFTAPRTNKSIQIKLDATGYPLCTVGFHLVILFDMTWLNEDFEGAGSQHLKTECVQRLPAIRDLIYFASLHP